MNTIKRLRVTNMILCI